MNDNRNETEVSDEVAIEDSDDLGVFVLEICGVKETRTSKLYQVNKFRDRLFMLLY